MFFGGGDMAENETDPFFPPSRITLKFQKITNIRKNI